MSNEEAPEPYADALHIGSEDEEAGADHNQGPASTTPRLMSFFDDCFYYL